MFSTTIIATIFVIGLLVVFHEFGHFITAKSVGMRVNEFAVGFGPQVVSHRHGETVYSLRAFPLGGFVKIAGMDPDEEQDEKSYQTKPIWARMLVIAAGSLMNFILPVLLFFFIILATGIDTPTTTIANVLEDSPAAQAGLQPGDRITMVNGAPIGNWQQFVAAIQANGDGRMTIGLDRNGSPQQMIITPQPDPKTNRQIIGVASEVAHYQPGPGEAATLAVQQTYMIATTMLSGIGQMITGKAPADVAGPIGVAQMAGQVAQLGIVPLLKFAAFLSINLGLINLLPVPVLDGGHIVTLAVEGIRGKPLSRDKLQWIQLVGFTLLMLLFLLATYKDISRLKLF